MGKSSSCNDNTAALYCYAGVCIIDDDRLIDDLSDLEGAFNAWQVCKATTHCIVVSCPGFNTETMRAGGKLPLPV